MSAHREAQGRVSELPLSVWPCAQTTSQHQRRGRYLPESNRHPAKMLPEIARRAIAFYSQPGDLVLDPLCGIGTTLVEAAHSGRRAIGVELSARWATLAALNVGHARSQGAPGQALVMREDARKLARGLLDELAGEVALIVTSPPYGDAVLGDPRAGVGMERARACEGRRVSAVDRRYAASTVRAGHYGGSGDCLTRLPYGHLRQVLATASATNGRRRPDARTYLETMAAIYAGCARMLAPGGFLVVVTKDMRAAGALRNISGEAVALCEAAGLTYWQHVIALHAAIGGGQLRARPSFWQMLHSRRALECGERTQLVVHEDVLVFRKPPKPSGSGKLKLARRGAPCPAPRARRARSTTAGEPDRRAA